MKIVYMGTPGFAVPALKRLIDSEHQVTAVVTQPDRPSGRGKRMQSPPVKDLALEHMIPVLQPERIKNVQYDTVLKMYDPDIIVVAAYGRILPPEVLNMPRFGCINIHASLLPAYRGAAPIQWTIINGDHETGVTIMRMDEGLDTGDIIASEKVEVLDDDDTHSVSNMLSVIGGEVLIRVLAEIERKGEVRATAQDHAAATLAPIMEKSDGLLDWNLNNEQIVCRIRGLQPWPGAFTFLHGKQVKILKAEPFADPENLFFGPGAAPGQPDRFDPGTISALIRGRGITVKTGDGHLLITELQPAGRKAMSASDAINGGVVRKGDEFISSPDFLIGSGDN
ncbi:methionyl-tRNA formyltransferase [candidate division BRC1 bacterium HGW-BRC1-1]|nr:MAG: methionyl-tRNA formyltransferase [candidate division BRC1 bacterium HGW-BRC1-1]